MTVEMKPVVSSNIEAVGYDPLSRELHVHFKNGGRYIHQDVDAEVHAAMMQAESCGRHYHKNIRGRFAHRRAGD